MKYAKYDQNTIFMVSKTRNPNLFPNLNIPRSTAKYWIRTKLHLKRKIKVSDRSTEYELQKAEIQRLKAEMKRINKELDTMKSYLAILVNNKLIKPPSDHRIRFQIIQIIRNNRGRNSIRSILTALRISFSTYKRWAKSEPAVPKQNGHIQKTCRSLTYTEISNLRKFYLNKSLFFYPLYALSIKAKKEQRLFASTHTWRKYINLFKLRRPVLLKKSKSKYPIGVRAIAPHELWHIDVTEFKIKKVKIYMQAIIDNYSRAVLSTHFISSISAANTGKLISKAIKEYGPPIKLMSDAGKENTNYEVQSLLAYYEVKYSVAYINTRYSNSMIEVFFRTLKSNYLSHLKIKSTMDLKNKVNFYIQNYNYEIPHSALNFRTPIEVLRNVSEDHYPKLFIKYRKSTLEERMHVYKNAKKKAPCGA